MLPRERISTKQSSFFGPARILSVNWCCRHNLGGCSDLNAQLKSLKIRDQIYREQQHGVCLHFQCTCKRFGILSYYQSLCLNLPFSQFLFHNILQEMLEKSN